MLVFFQEIQNVIHTMKLGCPFASTSGSYSGIDVKAQVNPTKIFTISSLKLQFAIPALTAFQGWIPAKNMRE